LLVNSFLGRRTNEWKEAQVMMIRDSYRAQSSRSTSCDKLSGVLRAFGVACRPTATPARVSRRMYLEVATVEVSTFVHEPRCYFAQWLAVPDEFRRGQELDSGEPPTAVGPAASEPVGCANSSGHHETGWFAGKTEFAHPACESALVV